MSQQLTILEWIDEQATRSRRELSERRDKAVRLHRPVREITAELRHATHEQLYAETGLSR